jgi:hypothetical protein
MSRRGYDGLPKQSSKLRKMHDGFETKEAAWAEDQIRAAAIGDYLRRNPDAPDEHELRYLQDRILSASSPASARVMRKARKKWISNAVPLVDCHKEQARFFTVINPRWRFPAGGLLDVNPRASQQSFRMNLRKLLPSNPKGWLIGGIDGDFKPRSATFQLHIHGIATGDYLQAVDNLRHQPLFKSKAGKSECSPVVRPVQIKRKEMDELPSVCGYLLKPFWLQRADLEMNEAGQLGQSSSLRIGEPHCFEVFRWFDRQRIASFIFSMNLAITATGLASRP